MAMKLSRTTVGILLALVVVLPAIASAQTVTASSGAAINIQQIVALYTQLVQMLEQEIAQLTAAQASTPALSVSCPIYSTPSCTGTLFPQGTDQNGCQLPPQCVANMNSANTGPTTTATPVINTAPAPALCTLTASPTSIMAGQSALLSWTATNAFSGSISPSVAGFALSSGSQTVTPSQTTDYFGSFTGAGGLGYCTALVSVTPMTTAATTTPVTPTGGTAKPSAGASCTAWSGIVVPDGQTVPLAPQTCFPNGCSLEEVTIKYYICQNGELQLLLN
jgi:hypothetical protein